VAVPPLRDLGGWSSVNAGTATTYVRSLPLPDGDGVAVLRLRGLAEPVHVAVDGGPERLVMPGAPVIVLEPAEGGGEGVGQVEVAVRAPHLPGGLLDRVELLHARAPRLLDLRTVREAELAELLTEHARTADAVGRHPLPGRRIAGRPAHRRRCARADPPRCRDGAHGTGRWRGTARARRQRRPGHRHRRWPARLPARARHAGDGRRGSPPLLDPRALAGGGRGGCGGWSRRARRAAVSSGRGGARRRTGDRSWTDGGRRRAVRRRPDIGGDGQEASVAAKSSKDIRNESRFMVLRTVYARHTVTRAQISAETGLSPATVTTLVGALVEQGVLREAGQVSSQGGRPTATFQANPGRGALLAVDVAETYVRVDLFDISLARLDQQRVELA